MPQNVPSQQRIIPSKNWHFSDSERTSQQCSHALIFLYFPEKFICLGLWEGQFSLFINFGSIFAISNYLLNNCQTAIQNLFGHPAAHPKKTLVSKISSGCGGAQHIEIQHLGGFNSNVLLGQHDDQRPNFAF